MIGPLLAACAGPSACEALQNALVDCDVRPSVPTCEDLAPIDQRALLRRLDAQGCDALYDPATRQAQPDGCLAFGWDCPPPLFPEDGPILPPRGAVVLVSGVDDTPAFDWNPDVVDAIADHAVVQHVVVPPWSSREVRALDLFEQLSDLGHQDVNLVCYAVGGLDCRYLVSPGGLFVDDPAAWREVATLVASVTTIATPHRGTNVADAVLTLPRSEWTELAAVGLTGDEEQLEEALEGLTLDALRIFNSLVVDSDDITYFSWAGVSHGFDQTLSPSEERIRQGCTRGDGQLTFPHYEDGLDPMSEGLWLTEPFAEVAVDARGERVTSAADGMVAVASAAWTGFEGCVPADHYDVIGRLGDHGVDPVTGFDARGFLLHVVGRLGEEGL